MKFNDNHINAFQMSDLADMASCRVSIVNRSVANLEVLCTQLYGVEWELYKMISLLILFVANKMKFFVFALQMTTYWLYKCFYSKGR